MITPWESAAESDDEPTLATVRRDADSRLWDEVVQLLARSGLAVDHDVELFVTARLRGRLVACLGLAKSVIKGVATDQSFRGKGILAKLMDRMNYEAQDLGRNRLFIYTHPKNRRVFESIGFITIAEVPHSVVLLENSSFGLPSYIDKLKTTRLPGDRIGAVVTNANPFTLGHQYLVEQAASHTDALHVFLVGEDASMFAPSIRLMLARESINQIQHKDRIVVHAGSPYIVSRATFPNYFIAEETDRRSAAAGLDLQLFRNAIGPALGITDRYVGTEPYSAVTAAYNAEMRDWLEGEGAFPPIRVHEIERLMVDGEPISASRVRAALAMGDLEDLARLVPAPTLSYLRHHFSATH